VLNLAAYVRFGSLADLLLRCDKTTALGR
jgi:hypothetical protein